MTRRSKAQWLALFEAHEKSGSTAAAFCREHKLCQKYFGLRRKQLLNEQSGQPGDAGDVSRFVPAVINASVRHDIVVSVGSLSVAIPLAVEPQWLAHLIKHLQG